MQRKTADSFLAKYAPGPVERLWQKLRFTQRRNLFWACFEEHNFGDWIGPLLFEKIAGVKPLYCRLGRRSRGQVFFTVGSILHHIRTPNRAVIWGSGIIAQNTEFARPARIHCVRGPYTRQRCLALGYDCPPVYGDPGLLLPRFLPMIPSEHRVRLGVIPHLVDQTEAWSRFHNTDVCLIDVCLPVESVIKQILKCKAIASSSLHGIIVAHAYGVPAVWMPFSDKLKGDNVKFSDYFASLAQPVDDRDYPVETFSSINRIINTAQNAPIPDVRALQNTLLASCPFRSKGINAPSL